MAHDARLDVIAEQIERANASVRAKVDHPFRVRKRQVGYSAVRHRGLKKNSAQIITLFTTRNLGMAWRRLMITTLRHTASAHLPDFPHEPRHPRLPRLAMVIAMPVQGVATSVMLFYGPSDERMMQGLMVDVPAVGSSQVAESWHEDSAAHHGLHEHAAPVRPDADNSGAGTDADGLTSPFPHNGKFTGSACAACCSALALPASFVLPEPSNPEQLVPMPPVEPVASHQPDGLPHWASPRPMSCRLAACPTRASDSSA